MHESPQKVHRKAIKSGFYFGKNLMFIFWRFSFFLETKILEIFFRGMNLSRPFFKDRHS